LVSMAGEPMMEGVREVTNQQIYGWLECDPQPSSSSRAVFPFTCIRN
jgi:hypothetical protein